MKIVTKNKSSSQESLNQSLPGRSLYAEDETLRPAGFLRLHLPRLWGVYSTCSFIPHPLPPKAIISLWNKQVALHPTSAHSPIPRVSRGLPHLFTSCQKEQNILSLWACPKKPLRYGETGRYWIVSNCYSEYVCLAEASPLHPKEGRDFFAKINLSPYWKIIILEQSGGGKNHKKLQAPSEPVSNTRAWGTERGPMYFYSF